MDELARLLRDFLELMQIAEEWNMPKLKEKLEWNIIHKFDMIQRLPHANQMSTYCFFGLIIIGLRLIFITSARRSTDI